MSVVIVLLTKEIGDELIQTTAHNFANAGVLSDVIIVDNGSRESKAIADLEYFVKVIFVAQVGCLDKRG